MAQNEIVNVLTIKTEDSQKTIKGLKKEISDLKKVLDNAVIGTEEFEQANRDLKVAQNELKAAMTGQKQSVEALDGSYDALVQEMAKLKKEWRATADVVKREDLGKQIDIINDQLKELDATIGNNQRKVGAYAEEIGKVLAKNSNDIDGLAGSVAGNAATFKQALAEQDDATISTRTKLESVQKVTAGLASGYAAIQGATALLGIENENLEKTFVKLQATMAIAQGVGGMKDLVEGLSRGKVAFAGATNGVKMFIKGLSGVQKAIIGTGIGALVVAVGLLIANWDKVNKVLEKFINKETSADAAAKRLTETYKNLANEIKNTNTEREREIELLKAEGKSNKEILEKQLSDAQADLAIYNKTRKELYKQISTWDYNMANVVGYKKPKDYDQVKANYDALIVTISETNNTITNLQNKIRAEEIIANRTAEETKKNNAVKIAEERSKAIQEIHKSELDAEGVELYNLGEQYKEYINLFKGNKKMLGKINEWYYNQRLIIAKKYIDAEIAEEQKLISDQEKLDKENFEKRVAASEKRLNSRLGNIDAGAEKQTYLNERRKPSGNGEINAIDNELSKLETLKNITNETLNLKLAAIEAEQALFEQSSARWMELENQKVALREQTNRTLGELSEQYYEQEKNRNRVLAGSITNTFTAALSSASAIIGALQEGIDTTTKEGFERNKKMQIANATIQMLVGITSALAGAYTTKSGPWDWILAGIQAATIATTGGIQIANIKKQTFDGGGSSSTPSVTPTMGLSDNLPVSYTRNLMGDMETDTLNAAQRVYILESDIDESLRKVEVRDNNTNF